MITAKQMNKRTKAALTNKGGAEEVREQVEIVSSWIIDASDKCKYSVLCFFALFPGTVRKLRASGFKVENCSSYDSPKFYITW